MMGNCNKNLKANWWEKVITEVEWLNNIERFFLNHKIFLEKRQKLSDLPKKLYDLLFWKRKGEK